MKRKTPVVTCIYSGDTEARPEALLEAAFRLYLRRVLAGGRS